MKAFKVFFKTICLIITIKLYILLYPLILIFFGKNGVGWIIIKLSEETEVLLEEAESIEE